MLYYTKSYFSILQGLFEYQQEPKTVGKCTLKIHILYEKILFKIKLYHVSTLNTDILDLNQNKHGTF